MVSANREPSYAPPRYPSALDPYYGHRSTALICAHFLAHHFGSAHTDTRALARFAARLIHVQRLSEHVPLAALYLLRRFHCAHRAEFPALTYHHDPVSEYPMSHDDNDEDEHQRYHSSHLYHKSQHLRNLRAQALNLRTTYTPASSGACCLTERAYGFFAGALMLAAKLLSDDTYLLRGWERAARPRFSTEMLATLERSMARDLHWDLHVEPGEFFDFKQIVREVYSTEGPYEDIGVYLGT